MTSVFINNQFIDLEPKKYPEIISRETNPVQWHLLYNDALEKTKAHVKHLIDNKKLDLKDTTLLHQKYTELLHFYLYEKHDQNTHTTDKPLVLDQPKDIVLLEALSMTKELVLADLTKDGLEPPKDFEKYCMNIIQQNPKIMIKAQERVEIKKRIAQEKLERLRA